LVVPAEAIYICI